MAECLEMIWVESGKVPCGKCAYCRASRKADWAFRIHYEAMYSQLPAWFVTLTYDEKSVKRVKGGRSLRFRDVQLMLKRMRKAGWKLRYVCVGEYGSQTQRPHYHMILFTDCPPEKIGDYWRRLWFGKVWRPLGHVHIGTVTDASIAYCMKYIVDKQVLPEGDEREKPRAQFSQGIGREYMTWARYDYHGGKHDVANFTAVLNGRPCALSRYYRRKFYSNHLRREEAQRMKKLREQEFEALVAEYNKRGMSRERMEQVRAERARRLAERSKHENLKPL